MGNSATIPEYQFVIVPLASHQDIVSALDKSEVEFVALDPAMQILAYDRYGTVPLLTMVGIHPGDAPRPPHAACSGTLIRRSDRSDIGGIQDLRGQRLSAVKPWSLAGWIAPWGLLEHSGIDPHSHLTQVVFEGTNEQVVNRVLDGSADVGAVDADVLLHLIRCQHVSAHSLCFINREGLAVPLVLGQCDSSTDDYPGQVLSQVASVSDALAQRVTDALRKRPLEIRVDQVPYLVRWSAPCNDSKVRRLLQDLMGPHYAESPGFPLPAKNPAWWRPLLFSSIALAVSFLAIAFVRNRYRRRENKLRQQLEHTRRELLEVRAEQQRINAILALAGCGIDIVDNENQIVFADSCLERKYGDWRGRSCHDYFCGSRQPCPECHRPSPASDSCPTSLDLDGAESTSSNDPHARVHYVEGESSRMIGIPFRDEGGRWLYARIHFPLTAFTAASVHGIPCSL